jgi:hypothetical protein
MWKANGKTTTLLLSWIVSSRNRDKYEMLPLKTKQSGGKLLPLLDLRGEGVFLGESPRGLYS